MANVNANDNTGDQSATGDDNKDEIVLTPEEFKRYQDMERAQAATDAGLDMKNPATELVLDAHFKSGMSSDDLKAVGKQFGVIKAEEPPATPPTEPVPPADNTGTQDRRDLATGGSDIPDVGRLPSPGELVRGKYDEMIASGTTREEARVWALDALLSQQSGIQAVARMQARKQDDAAVAAVAAQIATADAGEAG